MTVVVERTPKLANLTVPERTIVINQFFCILRRITQAENKLAVINGLKEFKTIISNGCQLHHFHWGFDDIGLWVKQRENDHCLIQRSIS